MLDNVSKQIRECLEHAEQCAREAAELPDGSPFRQDFLELQNRWVELARSIEFGEQLDGFTKSTPNGVSKQTSLMPARRFPPPWSVEELDA